VQRLGEARLTRRSFGQVKAHPAKTVQRDQQAAVSDDTDESEEAVPDPDPEEAEDPDPDAEETTPATADDAEAAAKTTGRRGQTGASTRAVEQY
jgi:hypothetical protein